MPGSNSTSPTIAPANTEVKDTNGQEEGALDHSTDDTAPQNEGGGKQEDGLATSAEVALERSHDDADMKDGDKAVASEDGKHPDDEHGDVVLETEEDTVIY